MPYSELYSAIRGPSEQSLQARASLVVFTRRLGGEAVAAMGDVAFDDAAATVLRHSDYHEVAAGFGALGLCIRQQDEVIDVIAEASRLAAEGSPVLVNCLIGKTDFRKGSISM